MSVKQKKTIKVAMQNENGSYRECTRSADDRVHMDDFTGSSFKLKEKTSILTGIVCLVASFIIHIWFLKLLTVNKFDGAFGKLVFYTKCVLTNKLDESFISENSFEILSLGFGSLLFLELSGSGSNYIEEKIKEIKKLNFKTVICELVIVHLILLIMRFAYPSLITIFSKISDVFHYEIAQFILAEGIIFIAFGIFHLKYVFEPVYEIYYPEYSKGITGIDKFLYETRKR